MINYKAAYHIENGALTVYPPEFEIPLTQNEAVPIYSFVHSIGMAIVTTVIPNRKELNGVIYLKKQDGRVSLDYDLDSEEAIQLIRQTLKKNYSRLDL